MIIGKSISQNTIHRQKYVLIASGIDNQYKQQQYGGLISESKVKLHEEVLKGDVLYILDTSRLQENLIQIDAQIKQIKIENKTITAFLYKDITLSSLQKGLAYAHYDALKKQMLFDIKKSIQSEENAISQTAETQTAINILERQYEIIQMQTDQAIELANKGITTSKDANELVKQALALKANITSEKVALIALHEKVNLAKHNQKQLEEKFKIELFARLNNNQLRLPELQRQAINLRDEISHSIITAPVAGLIVSMEYQTSGMYIPKGATIAKIAKPLDTPIVRLTISPQTIEQTSVGMVGILTISSLPQRNLTKINATLTSISPDAIKDEMGTALGYSATATISTDELQTALEMADTPLHLFADMPVSLALKGRRITFYEYIAAPFFQIFSGALQD